MVLLSASRLCVSYDRDLDKETGFIAWFYVLSGRFLVLLTKLDVITSFRGNIFDKSQSVVYFIVTSLALKIM